MKRSIPKRSRCPTLKLPQSTSSATLSMATGTTRSHLGEELIDLFIYGQLLTGVGSAGGSWLAGWSFDLTGSYHLAFLLSVFFYACGSVAFWLLREPAVIRQ